VLVTGVRCVGDLLGYLDLWVMSYPVCVSSFRGVEVCPAQPRRTRLLHPIPSRLSDASRRVPFPNAFPLGPGWLLAAGTPVGHDPEWPEIRRSPSSSLGTDPNVLAEAAAVHANATGGTAPANQFPRPRDC
jgi:hypothetical protein